MKTRLTDRVSLYLFQFHNKNRSLFTKIASIVTGAALFLFALPITFIAAAKALESLFYFTLPRNIELILSLPCLTLGLLFLMWAAYAQWTVGHGTPAPSAPTNKLITSPPYDLCRNPIELGAILYYFAIGTLFAGIQSGLISFSFGLAFGTVYNKVIEEKELTLRFGKPYQDYKRNTPFFPLPRFRRPSDKK